MAKRYFTPEHLKGEEWRDIPNFEGYYQASNMGRIKRIGAGKGATVGYILTPVHGNGQEKYQAVSLYKDAVGYHTLVHRLVYETFIGPVPDGFEIHHKDGNDQDNRLSNLDCLTIAEHKETRNMARGKRVAGSKLTADDVREIRLLYEKTDMTYQEIADMYGVTFGNIGLIIRRETWAWLD